MNGNISKEGIAKDLAWMKRVGIGGVQNFDANQATPQVVSERLTYMRPAWKDAFHFAVEEADRLGLEFAIASSPGWSETGGPWVAPQDGIKKLVWSVVDVPAGGKWPIRVPAPPAMTGPFQAMSAADASSGSGNPAKELPSAYGDIAVLAYPIQRTKPAPPPHVSVSGGTSLDQSALVDDNLETTISLPSGSAHNPTTLLFDYAQPVTVAAFRLFGQGLAATAISPGMRPRLEWSRDGAAWNSIAEVVPGAVPSTVSFTPVTAQHFRVVFAPAPGARRMGAAQLPPGIDLRQLGVSLGAGTLGGGLKIAEAKLSASPVVSQFEAKAGFTTVPDYRVFDTATQPDEPGVPSQAVVDLTARLRADGTLDWSAPRGDWRVVRLGWSLTGKQNHPATPEATGLEVDKLDAGAVRKYLERYLQMYRDIVGADLLGSRGITALVNDSTEVGAFNWTPTLVSEFKRLRGYDPTPWLPTVTGTIIGSRSDSDRFLRDFRQTIADLHASAHYGTIAEVAHAAGLKVYGEALENGQPSLGDDIAMRSYADHPMAAMWYVPVGYDMLPSFMADTKGASSTGHIYGRTAIAAESLTAALSPWAMAPAQLRPVIDLEFAQGINLPVIHTSVHQPVDDKVPGLSLGMFGQYFNRHETWAEFARPWVDYIARNAFMLQQGRNVADVAYFYGEDAPLTGLYSDKPVDDAPTRYAYDFLNAQALLSAVSNDGADLVTRGGARYRAVYLGGTARQMTLPVLRRLAELVQGGATVVGLRPTKDPGLRSDSAEFSALVARMWPGSGEGRFGKGRVIASTDIEAALEQIGLGPAFRFTGGQADTQILFVHRRLGDGDTFFLTNRKDRPETVEAHFRVTGKAPELWHADSGDIERVSYRIENGETVVPLTLGPTESVHVVFRTAAAAPALALQKPAPVELARMAAPWEVTFQPGRGAPQAAVTMPELTPLNDSTDPGIKYFSGIATYNTNFSTPRGWKRGQPLWLDLGKVHEVAEVSVDGRLAGYAWHAPYRIDIGRVVKPGRNRLQVRVANLWVNRLVGDSQPGAQKVTWTALPTYTAKAPLRPSGLIGPVRLLGRPH